MKNVVILGSTGSIGTNALRIIESAPERFRVIGLAARSNMVKLAGQIEKFRPRIVSVADKSKAKELRAMIKRRVKVVTGVEGAIELAAHPDATLAVSAMVGAAGLAPTLAAISSGKTVALANKEALVTAGEVVTREAKRTKVKIIPVDSEHSAIFQVMRGEKRNTVRKITLTASGGPFRNLTARQMEKVTVEQALKHPNWSMGPKITVDSATMMNKGLEVIEARWLFNLTKDYIDVLVHPQSVVHSMVEFCDSSVIAQMGLPDMRMPISFAMNYPDRLDTSLPSLDLAEFGKLTFEKPDFERFPCLALAFRALDEGSAACAALNAANEVAVEAFTEKRIGYTGIAKVVESVLNACGPEPVKSLAQALNVDKRARALAREAALRV